MLEQEAAKQQRRRQKEIIRKLVFNGQPKNLKLASLLAHRLFDEAHQAEYFLKSTGWAADWAKDRCKARRLKIYRKRRTAERAKEIEKQVKQEIRYYTRQLKTLAKAFTASAQSFEVIKAQIHSLQQRIQQGNPYNEMYSPLESLNRVQAFSEMEPGQVSFTRLPNGGVLISSERKEGGPV